MSDTRQHNLTMPQAPVIQAQSPHFVGVSPNHRAIAPNPSLSPMYHYKLLSPSQSGQTIQHFNFNGFLSPGSNHPEICCTPQSTSTRGETPDSLSVPPLHIQVQSEPDAQVKPRRAVPRRPLPPPPALPLGWAKWRDHDGIFYLNIVTNERCRHKPHRAASGSLPEESVVSTSATNGEDQSQFVDDRQVYC